MESCGDDLSPDDPKFRITPFQQMAASLTGALTTSLIMTPLDVVKIRLQAQHKNNSLIKNKCFVYCNGLMDHMCPCLNGDQNYWYRRPSQFTGTLDAFVKIARNEGPSSLWSGLSPTLVLAVPATVVYFVTYEQLRNKLKDHFCEKGQQPIWVPLVSGCTARLWSATVVSPLELIRTKMQSKKLSWLEIHQALQSLLQYHGYKGLWKGLQPTLFRDVPFSGIYWVTYETIKSNYTEAQKISFWYSFFSGSIAGSVAAIFTTPFDVVKTHQQIELAEQIFTEPPLKGKHSTFTILGDIYKTAGIRGMFAGLVPRIIKVAPACAIMVSTFEYGKTFFEVYNFLQYQDSRKS